MPTHLTMEGKALHDRLLELLPEGAVHPMEDCRFCLADALNEGASSGGGSTVTATPEEIAAAVAAATAEKDAEIAALKAAAAGSEVEAAVAAAVADKDAELAQARADLDAATVAANAEKAAREAIEQANADREAAEAAATAAEAVKAARLADLAELTVPFTPEQVTAKLDGWAALTDEQWADRKAEWADLVAAAGVPLAPRTLSGTRETDALAHRQGGTGTSASAVMGGIRELADAGIDPRTMH